MPACALKLTVVHAAGEQHSQKCASIVRLLHTAAQQIGSGGGDGVVDVTGVGFLKYEFYPEDAAP